MSTFYRANVTATNGQALVAVNSSADDIGILRERSFLQVGSNRIVEVKRGIAGSSAQIELAAPWPFATATADAIAGPTAGDLAEAVAQIRALNTQAADILSDALLKSGNLAGLANPGTARSNLGLTSAATTAIMSSLTDTTAGRLMPVGAFGLGDESSAALGAGSLNDIRACSIRGVASGEVTGRPSDDGLFNALGFAITSGYSSTALRHAQIYLSVNGEIAIRGGADTWGPWRELYHNRNILGTVSQSAGVPTGAVIERGSNANGEYVKFADGTMICRHIKKAVYDTAERLLLRWDFPLGFAAPDSFSWTASLQKRDANNVFDAPLSNAEYAKIQPAEGSHSKDLINIDFLSADASFVSTDYVWVSLFAIGRWY